MTKLKYENRGGRGFSTFHPFANLEQKKKQKKVKKPTKTELLLKDIKKNSKLKHSRWNFDDLSYKKIKLGLAIRIVASIVSRKKNGIYPILKKMQKDNCLYKRVKQDIESNYANISSSALKITIEQNKAKYK
ncbi:hypothetical protein GSB9_03160 [Flavobacteriaceae bacterium GSB9]|nr:hypothetical protein GSB9_03160 [Flavobacteriaceae bacterium GSB9]